MYLQIMLLYKVMYKVKCRFSFAFNFGKTNDEKPDACKVNIKYF